MGIGGLSFLFPGALLLGVFAPLIAFAYLKRPPKDLRTVSSLLIFKTLPREQIRLQSVKVPPRFYLELLALLLLVAVVAEPILRNAGEDIAIVVDNSLSMQTRDGSRSRYSLALGKLSDVISTTSGRYGVFLPAPRLKRLSPAWMSGGEVESALQSERAGWSSDNLLSVVEEIGASGEFDRIIVITDRRPEILSREATSSDGRLARIEAFQVGAPAANISVSSFREELSALSRDGRTITASILLSAAKDTTVTAELYTASGRETFAIAQTPLLTKKVALARDRSTDLSFTLPVAPSESSYFALKFVPTEPQLDQNPGDNQAFLALEPRAGKGNLLVTPSGAPLGLDSLRALPFEVRTPESYSKMTAEEISRHSLIVFHRTTPITPPKVASLYLMPPSGNPVFGIKSEAGEEQISSWREQHPITSYLDPTLFSPKGGLVFEPSPWTEAVLSVQGGPVVVAGESQGVRLVGSGLELLPFEGAKTPSSTVLLLNILSWLGGGEELQRSSLSGLLLTESTTFSVRDPSGKSLTPTEESPVVCEEPGLYVVTNRDPGDPKRSTRQVLAINSFFPEESTPSQILPVALPSTVVSELTGVRRDEILSPLLLWAVVLFLLTDLFLLVFRRGDASTTP